MANTKQQRKRVRITRRESQENLRFKSRIKTMFKSLTVAAQEDESKAAELGVELVSVIDKAADRGVIHKRNAAKKKARVYAIVKLPEGQGKKKQAATTEATNEKTKLQRRGERRLARKTKKDEARARQQAREKEEAEAAAVAAEAETAEETETAEEAETAQAEGEAEVEAEAEEAPTAETESHTEDSSEAEPPEEETTEDSTEEESTEKE